ncbi:Polygalacturonase, partial [Stylosanthes scabra]|nr:Polygalacturonase [Stylosanthes scabra]
SAKLQKGPLIESTNVDDDLAYNNINDRSLWKFKGLFMQSKDVVVGGDVSSSASSHSLKVINVNDYGAGEGDASSDTQAFEKAWEAACYSSNNNGQNILMVPKGYNNYQLKPIRFSGPCKSEIQVQLEGTIEATDEASDYSKDSRHWLVFDSVKKLSVNGGGIIDGNGKTWWQKSCKRDKSMPCKEAPTALTFLDCSSLSVEDLSIENAQQMHVAFQGCTNVRVSGVNVTSPGDSPNTDGIHVTNSHNVQISNAVIGTGDDCISIVSGSRNILATNITCGPGHGISIGSLGAGSSAAYVSGVTVKGAKISGTSNGVRIKTWQD